MKALRLSMMPYVVALMVAVAVAVPTAAPMLAWEADKQGGEMLAIERRRGESIEVVDSAGKVLRIHVVLLSENRVRLAFEDDARNFEINRPGAPTRGQSKKEARP